MAKSESGDDNQSFLGGGVQFNKAGASIPSSEPTSLDEKSQPLVPTAASRSAKLRTALIVSVLIVFCVVLYIVSNDSLGGVQHVSGHGGISPAAHSTEPPRNF